LILLLTEAIDAVRLRSLQAVVGNAHPTKKLASSIFEHTQSQVTRWEGGEQNATIKTLMRIAEATGTYLKISFEKVE